MKAEDIKKFLEFRKRFTKREWFEINKAVDDQENKRADQIILDDSDVNEILGRINQYSKNSININIKEEKLSPDDKELISKTIENVIRSKKNQWFGRKKYLLLANSIYYQMWLFQHFQVLRKCRFHYQVFLRQSFSWMIYPLI